MIKKLQTPIEINQQLEVLHPYVKVCFSELMAGSSLSAMNQRKQRAINSDLWDKYVNIGLAVELYKQTCFMNDKGAI